MAKAKQKQSEKLARIFKAYDVRGRVPDELDENLAYDIGRAYCDFIKPEREIAVGHDIRLSSEALSDALIAGLNAGGAAVVDLGQCGTEMVYFASFFHELAGGIMVTASHNPADYNGMKMVREQAKPLSAETGLENIKAIVSHLPEVERRNTSRARHGPVTDEYVDYLLKDIDLKRLKPLKIVCNAGNGAAGPILDALGSRLPFQFHKLHHEPDGRFPHGVPNPLLPENRSQTSGKVKEVGADLGIAWDGDFDRCFLFDEEGAFVDGYYVVGLLARFFLERNPGAKIVHDPRLIWDTIETVQEHHGIPIMHKSGHAFMKERMRREDAAYGGETSAHHYFRSFGYCDSGMLPWLVVCQMLSQSDMKLSQFVHERMERFPSSGEINRTVAFPKKALENIKNIYRKQACGFNEMDGVSLEFPTWRFNLRMSNTEPLVRLNVETRGDRRLLTAKTAEILALLEDEGRN